MDMHTQIILLFNVSVVILRHVHLKNPLVPLRIEPGDVKQKNPF